MNDVELIVERLRGLRCWTVVAGFDTGSVISLGFGRKIKRAKPLSNVALTEDERVYAAEIELTIYCSWRLRVSEDTSCSWRDFEDEGSRVLTRLKTLVGKSVISATVQPISFDLGIEFENSLLLEVFCDINLDEGDDNYVVSDPDVTVAVGPGSSLSLERKRPTVSIVSS